MAREVVVRVTDDFDKSVEADVSRILGWDGYDYVIDLSDKHDKELQELLTPYLEAAHEKIKQRKKYQSKPSIDVPLTRPAPVSTSLTPERRAVIRAWAKANGYEVGEKGVLAKAVVQAYEDEHGQE